MKQRIVITGGLGYIGSACAQRLIEEGYEVRILDDGRDSVAEGYFDSSIVWRLNIGSAEVRKLLAEFSPDVVIHLAASASVGYGERDVIGYTRNNVCSFADLLESLRNSAPSAAILFSSTFAVYGGVVEAPVDERHPRVPSSWYGWTKLFGEEMLARFGQSQGVRYLIFRYANVAGAAYGIVERRKKEEHLIPLVVQAAIEDKELVVNGTDWPTRDGTCVRDFVHVLDVADAHLLAISALLEGRASGEILNIGTSQGITVLEVISTVERISGRRIRWKAGPRRPGDPAVLLSDPSRAMSLLGWKPTRTFDQMIRDAWLYAASKKSIGG
jgi:UDP-glucose 4-epimerase